MSSETRSVILRVFISVSAIGLILFLMRDRLSETWQILHSEIIWSWIALGFLTYLLANMCLAVRLRLILQLQEIFLSYRETLHLVFVGLFFNLFLPSAVGGDLAKAYYAAQHSGKKMAATTAIILDRVIGFVMIIGLAMMAILLFSREIDDSRISQVVFLFGGIMVLTVFFLGSKRFAKRFRFLKKLIPSEKWKQRLEELYHTLYSCKNHMPSLLMALVISLVGQCFFIFTHYIATRSLGVEMNLGIFFIIVPVLSIVSMTPSLGGLGMREAGAIYIFSKFMAPERALALALVIDVFVYGFSLISGIFYALRGGLKAKIIHEIEEMK